MDMLVLVVLVVLGIIVLAILAQGYFSARNERALLEDRRRQLHERLRQRNKEL